MSGWTVNWKRDVISIYQQQQHLLTNINKTSVAGSNQQYVRTIVLAHLILPSRRFASFPFHNVSQASNSHRVRLNRKVIIIVVNR